MHYSTAIKAPHAPEFQTKTVEELQEEYARILAKSQKIARDLKAPSVRWSDFLGRLLHRVARR
jgi:hypothetical protein